MMIWMLNEQAKWKYCLYKLTKNSIMQIHIKNTTIENLVIWLQPKKENSWKLLVVCKICVYLNSSWVRNLYYF